MSLPGLSCSTQDFTTSSSHATAERSYMPPLFPFIYSFQFFFFFLSIPNCSSFLKPFLRSNPLYSRALFSEKKWSSKILFWCKFLYLFFCNIWILMVNLQEKNPKIIYYSSLNLIFCGYSVSFQVTVMTLKIVTSEYL